MDYRVVVIERVERLRELKRVLRYVRGLPDATARSIAVSAFDADSSNCQKSSDAS